MSANGKLCRMCAEIVYDSRNLYDNDCDNIQYINKFKQLFSDIIFDEENYSLPEHICSNCCTKLKDASNFKKQCISSLEYLKKCNRNFEEIQNNIFERVEIKLEVDLNEKNTENSSENIDSDTSTDFVVPGNCIKSEKVENCQEIRNKFAEFQKDNNTNSENQGEKKKSEDMRKLHCSVLKLKNLYPRVHVPNLLHNLDLDPFILLTPFTNHDLLFHGYQSEKTNNNNICVTTRATNHRTYVNSAVRTIEERMNEEREWDELKDTETESENAEVRVQNSEEIHNCFVCQKRFRSHSDLETHVTVHLKHSDESVEVVRLSGNIINEETIEIKEELTESNEEAISTVDQCIAQIRYSCKECNKHYSWEHDLKKHVMCVHRGMKPYSCNECHKTFGKKNNLDRHMNVHTGAKPYSCKQCQKQFGQRSTLYEHTRNVHGGVKRYSCEECHKQFARKNNLIRHSLDVHRGIRGYSCNECQKKFSQKSSLKKHMNNVHVKAYDASVPQTILPESLVKTTYDMCL